MKYTSIEEFYKESLLRTPEDLKKELGHFNIFKIRDFIDRENIKPMPYHRRYYYKISLIKGRNRAEYADRNIQVKNNALLFATPNIPYNWIPDDNDQSGFFCIFTEEFLTWENSKLKLTDMPIFKPGGYPVFELSDADFQEISLIYHKMNKELVSDYPYKYDLLRNYVTELIHYGQKLQPASVHAVPNAPLRITALFIELLERQFPIQSKHQKLTLRTARDYANQLAVNVNHLNKILKETTGKTTTEIITAKIIREAKILLKQTDWNVSEIAYSLGFEEPSYFSNFFSKQTTIPPSAFRQ